MKNITARFASFLVPLSLPLIAFAQTTTGTKDLKYIIGIVVQDLNLILELLMGVAVVMFVFYVIKYFMLPTDNRTEAWQYVLWALVGFFVIFSMWGLVNILVGTFGLQTNPSSWSTYFKIFPTS
jgi:hypothetical protein